MAGDGNCAWPQCVGLRHSLVSDARCKCANRVDLARAYTACRTVHCVTLDFDRSTSVPTSVLSLVMSWGSHGIIDPQALLLDTTGRVRTDDDLVFFNAPQHPTGSVILDDATASSAGLVLALPKVAQEVERVVATASVDDGDLSEFDALHVTVYDGSRTVLAFDILEPPRTSAMIVGEFYRSAGAWAFKAVANGWMSGLAGLVTEFGVGVEGHDVVDADPAHAALHTIEPVTLASKPPDAPPVITVAPTNIGNEVSNRDVVDRIQLAPDAGLIKSLGANHTFESAVADIIDNSIDAGAVEIAVKLRTDGARLVEVHVVDNGMGMTDAELTSAMTIGQRRNYSPSDLGHFGMGLKSASLGHADVLTVWSSRIDATPAGRRIRRADFSKDFSCEILSSEAAAKAHVIRRRTIGGASGTTVVWSGLRNAYRGRSPDEAQSWLANVENKVRTHLGVVFHRVLAAGNPDEHLHINLYIEDAANPGDSVAVPVAPIDPFGYQKSGHPDYPKTIPVRSGDVSTTLTCHVWPGKTDVTGFRVGAKSGEQFQGFYIYRNNRLLQVGGWSDIATSAPSRQLARVVLDDSAAIGKLVTMNPEKQGMKFEPAFHDAIAHANTIDGKTFDNFLQDAETVYIESNKRGRKRKPAIRPDKGFSPAVRKAILSELEMIDGISVKLQWTRMGEGEFMDVDMPEKTLWLNSRYRPLFTPSRGSLNDAPVLKSLLYLLTHHIFEGQKLGARHKDEIALWKAVLGAAVVNEEQTRRDAGR